MSHVTYDSRSILLDGERTLILSGAIHYPRSTPEMWPGLMEKTRDAGLNTVETYVFWNLHERQRGQFDFSGRLNLRHFCQLAQEHGLHVILRIGPYICAETNYGGFPAWLRDVPGVRMRTYNEPFMREMERWVRFLCDTVDDLFAPRGGPIIMAQLENEYDLVADNYGEEGKKYLRWVVDLGKDLDLGVPLIMCKGAATGALETLNGFYGHRLIDEHFERHPDQPAIWTENWPGWYSTYTVPQHSRSTADVAYAVARFFAAGGTGMNYYMWHGGTNFDRESMYLQTTSYDFDAPLDEYGLTTGKYDVLSRLHHTLADHADALLDNARPAPQALGDGQTAFVYGGTPGLAFLCNDEVEKAQVTFMDTAYDLAPQSVTLVSLSEHGTRKEMDTAEPHPRSRRFVTLRDLELTAWNEPLPTDWPASLETDSVTAAEPIEQLLLTHDETDYCWYTTEIKLSNQQADEGRLRLEGVADFAYVFIDGERVAQTSTPLTEARGPIDGEAFIQTFKLSLNTGAHKLSILCCSLGLIKGDWMLGNANMAEERKGLWGAAYWNDKELAGPWRVQPGLVGERGRLYAGGRGLVDWQVPEGTAPLRWLKATFDQPEGLAPLAADLQGLGKGMLWLNGRCVGRYWLTPGAGESEEWLQETIEDENVGAPTQRYYHLPREWIEETNTLVLFEEQGKAPSAIRLVERR